MTLRNASARYLDLNTNYTRGYHVRSYCILCPGYHRVVSQRQSVLLGIDKYSNHRAIFSSIAATLFGAARAVAEAAAKNDGNVDIDSIPEPDLNATTIGSCLCGLTQLGIFFDAFFSLKEGGKTDGYAFSRLFEALVESSAQSLLQLYIAMKHSRRAVCG